MIAVAHEFLAQSCSLKCTSGLPLTNAADVYVPVTFRHAIPIVL